MTGQVREAYLESKVLAADPLELVRILYRAAVEAVEQARKCLAQGDAVGRSRQITRAYGILTELALALDHEAGGAISRNLAELYDYMQRRLLCAHMEQSDGALAEVGRLLSTLLEGWEKCQPAQADVPLVVQGQAIAEYAGQGWVG